MGGSLTGLGAPDHHLCLLSGLCGGEGLGLGHFAANRRRDAGSSRAGHLRRRSSGAVCCRDVLLVRQPSDEQNAPGWVMRHITEAGLDPIKRFEGFGSTIYICPAGYPTTGYSSSPCP